MSIQERNCVNALLQHETGNVSDIGGGGGGDHLSGHEVRQVSVSHLVLGGCDHQFRDLTQ